MLVLNEYRLITEFFTLKADSEVIAKEWMKQINAAQVHVTVTTVMRVVKLYGCVLTDTFCCANRLLHLEKHE